MEDGTPPGAQTPESTGLPTDLFEKAQAAATEKGRPIYVYRADRAGRYSSKWEPVEGATPAAVIEPRPAAPAPPREVPTDAAPDLPPGAPATAPIRAGRVTLYAAGGQAVHWEGVTDVAVEDAGRVVRFRDADGSRLRLVVGGGSVGITEAGADDGRP